MDLSELRAERDRALARRQAEADQERRRRRAVRLLSGDHIRAARWNASPTALKQAIAEVYTKMDAGERRRLLEVALEVQRTERPHIDPMTVHTRPPVPEFRPKPARRAARMEIPALEEEDTEVATKTFTPEQRKRVRAWLSGWRAKHPKATAAAGLSAMQEEFGATMTLLSFKRTYWDRAAPSKAPMRAAPHARSENRPTPAARPGATQPMISRPSDAAEDEPGFPPPAAEASSPPALTPEQERHADSGSVPDGAPDEVWDEGPLYPRAKEAEAAESVGTSNERRISAGDIRALSLMLGFREIPADTALGWDDATREAVAEYLAACIADANDNVVEIPTMPEALAPLGYYQIRQIGPDSELAADLKFSEAIHELAEAPYRGADRVAPNGNGAHREAVISGAVPHRAEYPLRAVGRAVSEIVEGERELATGEERTYEPARIEFSISATRVNGNWAITASGSMPAGELFASVANLLEDRLLRGEVSRV